jgi:hypothetical protein
VRYNSDHGTFTFRSDERGSIYIEGEGILRHWTEKAVNRAGFAVSRIKTDPSVIIPAGDCKNWRLIRNEVTTEFRSIYDLIGRLTLDFNGTI